MLAFKVSDRVEGTNLYAVIARTRLGQDLFLNGIFENMYKYYMLIILIYENIQYYKRMFLYTSIYESRIFSCKTKIPSQEYFIAYKVQEIS